VSSSLIGRRLGKYEITELLGQGGMATVYKGYQPDIDRFVAVKVLPPHPGQDNQFVDRFRLEARTIAQLQHPHILPMHDYGSEGNTLYLIMAYLDGGSLKDRIEDGPLPLHETETILRQIASALDYAHRRGVIHRDIKPDNILLDREGHALLADFGIVKILEGETTAGLTGTGGVLGTPAYMAPEQSQGLGVTARADIYALGVIVYEMLTGRQPYQADTPMQVMLKHITDPVPNPLEVQASLPKALEPVMLRVLAKDPESRYPTATEFAQEFLRALHRDASAPQLQIAQTTQNRHPAPVSPTPTPPTPVPETPPTGPQVPARPGTSPILLLGGFAIIALLAVIIVLLVTSNDESQPALVTNPTTAPTSVPPTNVPPTSVPVARFDSGPRTYGRLSYSTTHELGDTINLQVNGLRQPDRGQTYYVWLQNSTDDTSLNLGALSLDGLGNSVHHFVDEEARVLPAHFDRLLLTAETDPGASPSDEVVYQGSTPIDVRDALHEIFVASPAGFSGGSLYGGLLAEAELAVIHTSYEHGTHDLYGLINRTEHTINILMNTEIDYDRNNLAENPGFKLGVPYLADAIEQRLAFDFSAEGLRSDLRSDVVRVQACLNNTRRELDKLVELEVGWTQIENEVETAFAQSEIRKSEGILNALIEGVDLNSNNQIEGFPGECGLRQIPTFGLLIGNMDVLAAN
jgi:serine/threonine protein kinase